MPAPLWFLWSHAAILVLPPPQVRPTHLQWSENVHINVRSFLSSTWRPPSQNGDGADVSLALALTLAW